MSTDGLLFLEKVTTDPFIIEGNVTEKGYYTLYFLLCSNETVSFKVSRSLLFLLNSTVQDVRDSTNALECFEKDLLFHDEPWWHEPQLCPDFSPTGVPHACHFMDHLDRHCGN